MAIVAVGRQALVNAALLLVNCRLPFEEILTEVKLPLYKATGKGKARVVIPSSKWLPVSVVPGTIVPLPVVIV